MTPRRTVPLPVPGVVRPVPAGDGHGLRLSGNAGRHFHLWQKTLFRHGQRRPALANTDHALRRGGVQSQHAVWLHMGSAKGKTGIKGNAKSFGHVRPWHIDAREAGGLTVTEQQGLHRVVGVVQPAVNQIPLNDVNGSPQRPVFQNGGAGRDGQGRSGSAHDSLPPKRQKRRMLFIKRLMELTSPSLWTGVVLSKKQCNSMVFALRLGMRVRLSYIILTILTMESQKVQFMREQK